MPRIDYTYRRWAAANAILGIIQQEKPDAIRQLIDRFWEVFGSEKGGSISDEAVNAVALWCDSLNLRCQPIESEALTLALMERLTEKTSTNESPVDGPDAPCYHFRWIPGESKSRFIDRALAEFYRKRAEQESGALFASSLINPKHVKWLVRFQVNEEQYDRIAKSDRVGRQDVKRGIKNLASLLDLELRSAPSGRPRGSVGPKKAPALIVRHKRRT